MNCAIIESTELKAMSDKELIKVLRTCEKLKAENVEPLKQELQERRDLANSSCKI